MLPYILFFGRTEKELYDSITNSNIFAKHYEGLAAAAAPSREPKKSSVVVRVPSHKEYRSFANRILTPGIPDSLPPIGSFYRPWSASHEGAFGRYLSDHALHVKAICELLSIEISHAYQATPDHLLILIELLIFFDEHAPKEEVIEFIEAHFSWLGLYKEELALRQERECEPSLKSTFEFYLFLIDALESSLFAYVRGLKPGDDSYRSGVYVVSTQQS